jgi:hypothetical protein
MTGKIVGALITGVIGIIGFTVVKSIASELVPAGATSGVMGTLINILPIVFIVVVILGMFSAIGGIGGKDELGSGEKKKQLEVKIEKNGRKIILMLTKSASSLGGYINNLDTILGIKTVNNNERTTALHPLILQDNNLYINTYLYDWYLVDKHPDMPMFKVVGLHKTDASENVVYVVGNNDGEPYLFQVPNKYIEEQSQKWIEVALTKV